MKFGIRTPSLKRRIAARTSWKRVVRHSLGLKAPRGMGILTNPKKALYNKVYNKTSVSVDDLLKIPNNKNNSSNTVKHPPMNNEHPTGIEISNTGNIIRSSSKALTVTSKNFQVLRQQITDIYNQRIELLKKLNSAKTKLFLLSTIHFGSYLVIVGFFYKGIANSRKIQQSVVKELEKQVLETFVKLTFADKSQLEKSWLNCIDTFNELMSSEKIWDITYAENVDRAKARTVAQTATKRTPISKTEREIEFVKSDLPHLFLPNANGPDVFLFPTFLLLFKDNQEFGIFDLKDVKTTMKLSGYVEEESVPKDTEIIQHTWKKANKDGSMDKRFKGNYQIPIVKYGDMTYESEGGLEESFMFSNFDAFTEFAKTYEFHASLLSKL
ncbi:hypothetical protein A2334_02425 [Candidatus Roizmanbacteria bacterium RIFOXYB2_FULL_38_10]|uniref:Uncharacterized protein n=1 Tax=Candidatus Roizmanbacteria bacterium RIFOXYD1_FULL_38_12 TaxID=1802093 RepID=A0A1F7L050_9BACT|nr:MAG: hypothetical protein A3K47_01545 [Candidatus Roizmanbacteria bacterium RIFOXYA2_FULL_38_14]OGK63468.1 MAG: hypothetical protein A3K27_01545 [Candidatus Roizmanbacteria bacterium RIFOXYA1_FULL_37_12]OGK65314.1 MAG: hypothetical protein A3K38_01545 [Candidatus Roizmanbacteria bacterium RIFOXYB1_FULL_40_23]OGK67972.1 MAG: hypothetical protein A2334_02425 [Candidatus Roizmanbacteria bacterium RIFOXYB2_FULL_38_10]OGK69719.1 MAG: hypothetical protein A3K21_01550 [Candidatus Roizmanbacteria ba